MLHNKEHNWRATEEYAQCEPCMTTSQWSTGQAYSKGKALRNQYVLYMHFHTHSLSLTHTQIPPLITKPVSCSHGKQSVCGTPTDKVIEQMLDADYI